MQPITSYAKDDRIRVVIQGHPGSGKSCLAMQFPKPYFIDLDGNLGGPVRWAERSNMPLPVGYDVVDKDPAGNVIPPKQRFLLLDKLLQEAQANPAIETIVIDSATNLSQLITDEVCRQQNKNSVDDFKDGRQFWGFYYRLGVHMMGTLKLMRKHIVLTAHEKTNKTMDGSIVYPIKLAWPGQLGQIIGAFFTDMWRCEARAIPSGLDTKCSYIVRTTPDSMYELKNSLGLPPTFEFKWETIAAKLAPQTNH